MAENGRGWRPEALCRRRRTPVLSFFDAALEAEVKSLCGECPSRLPGLWFAIEERIEAGVYGGMGPEERQRVAAAMSRQMAG